MKLTIIGDVHGKVERYKEITDNCDFSICVGDFGFEKEWMNVYEYFNELQLNSQIYQSHWINMGNHDFIPLLMSEYSLKNFTWFKNEKIFTVRGAESIDRHLRAEGIDWFANEELNYQEQLEAFDWYCKVKPQIVISHDCPQIALETMFKMGWTYGKSQTRTMLEMMFREHKPELWVFGHHHFSCEQNILGTRFVCLDELETLTIEL